MEENEFNIDDVFDTGKHSNEKSSSKGKHEKPRKQLNKKAIVIVAIIVGILLLITLGIILFIKFRDNNKPDNGKNLVYDEFEPLVSRINDDTYYIFGAKNNIAFEVEKSSNFSYKIYDKNENEITANLVGNGNKITIKAPNDNYKDGETYKLKITNGTFTDKRYGKAKEIVFNIARPASNSYTLKEGVYKIEADKISIKDDNLTVENQYKENDIIVVTNGDYIKDSYKIAKVNDDGTYKVATPKLEDIFDDIDYYGMEKINLYNFESDEDLKSYLTAMIRKSILESLVDTVYADANIVVKNPSWSKKNQTLTFSVTIDNNEGNKLFNADGYKKHKASFEFYVVTGINLYKNVSLNNYDYAIEMTYKISNAEKLKNIDADLIALESKIANSNNDYDASWLTDNYKKVESDKINFKKSLGKLALATEVPGLSLNFDLGFNINSDIKAILDAKCSGNIDVVSGINSDNVIYSNIDYTVDGSGTLVGDGNSSLGGNINVNLNYFNDVVLKTKLDYTLDSNGKSTITKDDKKDQDKKIIYEVKAENYFKILYDISGNNGSEKFEKTILDTKKDLGKYEKKAEFVDKTKKEEEKVDEDDFVFTAEQVRTKLQNAYDVVGAEKQWSIQGGTFTVGFNKNKTIDVANNKFIETVTLDNSVTYTCSYDYLNKVMSCDNYDEALNYVKAACDNIYNEYLNYMETGSTELDEAMEWEEIYPNGVDSCYYEVVPESLPSNFDEDFNRILGTANLTNKDLQVLKAE